VRFWLAVKGLQMKKSRETEKPRKKVSFSLAGASAFLPKQWFF
jgi:hypothetical protein